MMMKSSSNPINPIWVASCGIDCLYCRAHMRDKQPCPGCRVEDASKPKTRLICKIKTCEKRLAGKFEYCFECSEFPCQRLIHLDTRYRTKYGVSPVDNLLRIRDTGIDPFMESERQKWTCPECGSQMCIHEPSCPACGYLWRNEV